MGTYAMTGGATGIGAAIKQRLRNDQHHVIVIDIKDADIVVDLSHVEGREHAIARIHDVAGDGLDGFISCAGVGSFVKDHALIASVNYFGSIELIEGVRELLRAKRGSVVMVSSNSAPRDSDASYIEALLKGDEEQACQLANRMQAQPAYSGSKQAVARWMRRNSKAYAEAGIRLNAIAPGYTQTPMTEEVEQDPTYGKAIEEFKASIPVGFPGTPEDMASATAFLLSAEARFICGSVLFIDGGHDAMFRPDQF